MSGVVVLNASFEPLGVVPVQRAVSYIVKGAARIFEEVPGEFVRSADLSVPVPRVVYFNEDIAVPVKYDVVSWSRRGLLDRDRYTCGYCGNRGNTVDHIIPQCRGGKNTWSNTIACCFPCNNKKGDKSLIEAGLKLLFDPKPVYRKDTLLASIEATGADLRKLNLAGLTL